MSNDLKQNVYNLIGRLSSVPIMYFNFIRYTDNHFLNYRRLFFLRPAAIQNIFIFLPTVITRLIIVILLISYLKCINNHRYKLLQGSLSNHCVEKTHH
jgi:hypothetical protein